ncbi:Transthyretin-like family protein [Ancylostoma caninum]|uniref:Transthyretin-like family protein n=1 Tax=Ancylostoma caninum TaxID=29170 RepID=A0A368G8J9_ANCCA|nr:Transthyretin-like family protein [Ancylostoma caninum]
MHRALLLVLAASAVLNALLDQSVSIRGVLRCRTVPLKNGKVALLEKRTSPLSDVLMVSNTTDLNGEFYLNGSTSRIFPISPLLHIEKDCKGKVCHWSSLHFSYKVLRHTELQI